MTARVRVRPGTYLTLLPDGVETWTGRGRTFLAGANTRRWTERLQPLLRAELTRDQILEMVPSTRRSTARKLLDTLIEVGVLDDGAAADPAGDRSPAHPRCGSAVVVGSAAGAGDMLDGLTRAGVPTVGVTAAQLQPVDRAALTTEAAIVVHVVESSRMQEIASVERYCGATAIPLVQFVLDGSSAWWQIPGTTARWSDVRTRAAGLRRSGGRPGPTHDWSHEPLRVVATNQVAQSVLALLTRSGTRDRSARVVEWSPADLAGVERPLRRHPFATAVDADDDTEFAARVAELENRPAVAPETFSERVLELMDDHIGLFTGIEHGNLPQVPLATGRCTVADPVGLVDGTGTPDAVICSDLDLGSVRRRIAMTALAAYAGRLFDPRRCVDVSPSFRASAATDPWAAARELRTGRAQGRIQAFDVLERRVVRLDTRDVVVEPAGSGRPTATGVGWTWGGALQDGLLQHVERRTRDGLAAGTIEPRRTALPTQVPSEQADRVATLVAAAPETLEIYDVTSEDLVPALLCVLGNTASAVGCGVDHVTALTRSLLGVLHAAVLGTGEHAHEPAASSRTSPPAPFPAGTTRSIGDLARALRGDRHGPAVVPLDHDPAVTAVLPSIVRVVLP